MHKQRDETLQPLPPPSSVSSCLLPRRLAILCANPEESSNQITTSRYNAFDFVPRSLWELLHPRKRFANFYFLVVGFMQCFPSISPTNGYPSTWLTLAFLVAIDMFLIAREDRARYRADCVANSQTVEVLRPLPEAPVVSRRRWWWQKEEPTADFDAGTPQEMMQLSRWEDVRVGDVVKVSSRDCFPADLLLLRGSDPPGQCWVNTKPLDGESDLKLRLAPKQLAGLLEDDVSPYAIRRLLRGTVLTEAPNDKVNDFTGQLLLVGQGDGAAEPILLSEENVLLRGCQLRNTDWILGLVLTCGKDTKIEFGREGLASEAKVGRTASMINTNLIGVTVLLVAICVLGASLSTYWSSGYAVGSPWYLAGQPVGAESFGKWVTTVLVYFLLNYQFIPVALYVSMNLIFMLSRYFMLQDVDLYDGEQDEPCQVRSMSLLEELGQVSHIFSDKTGTLTSNHMQFRRLVVGGCAYGCGETAISRSVAALHAEVPSQPVQELSAGPVVTEARVPPPFSGCRPATASFVAYEEDPAAPSIFTALEASDAAGCATRELVLAMAVNHSVFLEMHDGRLELSASSPDEQAFVAAAENFGLELAHRDLERGLIQLRDKRAPGGDTLHTIEVLHVFAYTSDRKRMSVVVRLPPALVSSCGGGAAERIYTKGADSVLLDMLAPGSNGSQSGELEQLDGLLHEWASIALRTLVWGKRELPNYAAWASEYMVVIESPSEALKRKVGEPNAIDDLQAQLEANLTLQGATAIEDKLQDGVPEVLRDLRRAGIKIWMLTGDKVGTAKNIATACQILPPSAEVLELTTETFPVLAEIRTAELMAAQAQLQSARAVLARSQSPFVATLRSRLGLDGQDTRSSGSFEGGAALIRLSPPRWLPSWLRQRFLRQAVASEALWQRQLERVTAELDEAHPQLADVRRALAEQQRKMIEQMERARFHYQADHRQAAAVRDAVPDFCLILDEKAIEYCTTLCRDALAAVSDGCRSVVACRARKDQKAQLLQLIKREVPSACCLAIGDGANDVAMIQAGHIGVGIIGKEGMQAVNNSDFAIGKFRFLRNLLLVHGRYNYRRYATFAYYMFYKNVANVMVMFIYSLLALASGGRLFITVYIETYNLAYTALPIVLYGIADQDVPKALSASVPRLYTAGIRRIYFSHFKFWLWMAEGVGLALVITLVPLACLSWGGLPSPEDGDISYDALSFTLMCLVCVCVNLRLVLELHSWSVAEHVVIWGTIVYLELTCIVYSYLTPPDFITTYKWDTYNDLLPQLYSSLAWWLTVVLTIVVAIGPRAIVKAWHSIQDPSDVKTVMRAVDAQNRAARQRQRLGVIAARVPIASSTLPSKAEQEANARQRHRRTTGFAFSSNDAASAILSRTLTAPFRSIAYAARPPRQGNGSVNLDAIPITLAPQDDTVGVDGAGRAPLRFTPPMSERRNTGSETEVAPSTGPL